MGRFRARGRHRRPRPSWWRRPAWWRPFVTREFAFTVAFIGLLLVLFGPDAAFAANSIPAVIDNTRNWIVGIAAGLATLFLTLGGIRYLLAGGDPGEVEKAKGALKAAAVGYGIAILAPVLLAVLQGIVGDPGTATTPPEVPKPSTVPAAVAGAFALPA
ncbi:pilin (plasmid) [Embleya sp. NBC_00888]|uniref:pilin n=1 Tax=Embleya sp. NBC_00888 TaxID=2975960 RepID=UPI003864AEC0|nr:pilin [Embleya sp. NBC_00888]